MNPDANIPAPVRSERPLEVLRRVCLMGDQPPERRRRALAMRLRELGFKVHRLVRLRRPAGHWEADLRVTFHGLPPPVATFRERLRHALKMLSYRCPNGKIRVQRIGFRLKMRFPWP
jgi:hypothetical protein